ncbi:MAG: hypothetical protein JXL67_07045, partial [Calditrichaeota bacterium]|nr:hypothetical protein [Calditrichota bacterium]
PHDLIFTPWNRDLAFNEFYRAKKGEIDAITGVNLLATSPINLPHACDGKITTSEMAENLVFLAHSGKVTLREKFVGENRRIPDLPGAVPRLSLGYSAVSPVFVAKKLKALKPLEESPTPAVRKEKREAIIDSYNFNKRNLWFNTVYPASEAENWFVSGTAAYWRILNDLPGKDAKILDYMQSELAELNCRYLYNTLKEGLLSPLNTRRVYDQYKFYQIPRIKGTILLHQLRVLLGNDKFCTVMNTIHERYREKEMRTEDFIWTAEKIAEIPLRDFILQWLERDDLPEPNITASRQSVDNGWEVNLSVTQSGFSYHFLTSVKIVTDSTEIYQIIEISNPGETFTFTVNDKPHKILFNALNDVLLKSDNYFTWSNFFDDFNNTLIICGTRRQIEANHTLARRFSKVLADRYTEILTPVRKDSEINTEELKNFNLIILGSPEDNSLAAEVGSRPGLETGKNYFKYNEIPYGRSDDGIFLSFPSPYNSERAVYLFHANSASQLYQMTRAFLRMPSWAIFRGDRIVEKGYHLDNSWMIELGEMPE